MKKILILAAAVALSTASMTAVAAGQPFVRAEAGHSDNKLGVDGMSASESDTAVLVGGGYWFTPNIAIEGHVGTLYNEYLGWDTDLDVLSLGVGVAVKKNFGPNNTGFFVGARAGVARMTVQLREDDFDVLDDESSTKPYFGVNAGYDFSRRWGMSLNYDRRKGNFDGFEVEVDTVTVAGEFRFK